MPETSSEKSKPARKGTSEAASQSAAAAFATSSGLSLGSKNNSVPPEQAGRRRLTDSYFIPRANIIPDPEQPRQDFNELEMIELVASVKERGIKQPLTVRWNTTIQKYMVIDGGRRFEAATRLKLIELPCWVQEGEGKEVLIDQIVHNWQRSSLRPMETADALARLRDEFGMTQQQICRATGKGKSEVSKFLTLADKVDPNIQQSARSDNDTVLSKRHLYSIAKLKPDDQREVADAITKEKLTATQTEALVEEKAPSFKVNKPTGLAARQRRFRTATADVVITFRRSKISDPAIADVLNEVQQQLNSQ